MKENKEFTYQLMDAFITQERFNIIDTRNLPILIDEKNLHDFIEHPYLGLKEQSRIWIDVFLLGYVRQSRVSINMFASLVDLETGEILATKDVFEKMDSIVLSPQILQEHMVNNCYALANKFKEHFPLCEGKVISLNGDELMTSICKSDGLKRGMKLIIFEYLPPYEVFPLDEDLHEGGDFEILGEVRVKEVSEQNSLGILLRGLESYDFKDISINLNDISINLGTITR